MNIHRAILGLCMLCALVFSAFAAQSANAETKGTTVFTCKNTGPGGGFTKAHCAPADAGAGEFSHLAVAENTTAEITGTSVDTEGKPVVSKLKSVQSGVTEEMQSPLAHLLPEVEVEPGKIEKSWVTNKKDPVTGEHYIEGVGWVDYTEVAVTQPAGKGCRVKNDTIITNKMRFTTKGLKTEKDEVHIEPASGTVFTEFVIEGCSVGALNHAYRLEGSLNVELIGATLKTTHANITAQGKLTMSGQKTGLEAEVTVKATDKAAGDVTDTPLSATTVPTP
jgi:hypothetical protein